MRRGSTLCASRPQFAPYESLDAVADRLQKNNRRLAREQAVFLARHWAEVGPPTVARASCPTRATSCRFRWFTGLEETYAIWRNIAAPTLWVAAADSNIPRWLDEHPEGEGGADNLDGIRRRLAHIPDGRLEIIADAGSHAAPRPACGGSRGDRGIPRRRRESRAMTSVLGVRNRRGAYVALAVLTLIWGSNWVVMKLALDHAHPVVFNVERTWIAVIVLFGALVAQGKSLRPVGIWAIIVTGFLQTTVNFGSTTMALAGGGAGRTSVLVFTMPFWTLLIAWPVLHERVRGVQWLAIARRVHRARAGRGAVGMAAAIWRRGCGRSHRDSAGRRERSRPSSSSSGSGSTC